ncbi:MAG: 39S ribosomal protein L45, mitochondrial [Marteilia pararefringens]
MSNVSCASYAICNRPSTFNLPRLNHRPAILTKKLFFDLQHQQKRFGSKHYDPKFSKARSYKQMPLAKLTPIYLEELQNISINEHNYMKKFLIQRHHDCFEWRMNPREYSKIPDPKDPLQYMTEPRQIYLPSSSVVLPEIKSALKNYDVMELEDENYDEIVSTTSKVKKYIEKRYSTYKGHYNAVKDYKKVFEDYDKRKLLEDLLVIYKNAADDISGKYDSHNDFIKQLRQNITEHALPKILNPFKHSTIRWAIIERSEKKLITLQAAEFTNLQIYQAAIHLKSKQILNAYDRFGLPLLQILNLNNDGVSFTCEEFLIFERIYSKQIEFPYWRLHSRQYHKDNCPTIVNANSVVNISS